MAVKHYNPTTPGRRIHSVTDYSVLSPAKKTPKGLFKSKNRNAGRNISGKITVRHQGGGHKRVVRILDYSRAGKFQVPAKVQSVEYDSSRTGFVSLLAYKDGEKRYILSPMGMKVGDTVIFSDTADIKPGNRLKFKNIPVGTFVHDIEVAPGKGGMLARSAGAYAILQTVEDGYALLKMPSGEIRKVTENCAASIGQVSNNDWMNVRIGKAGRMRHMGWRPSVRGKVMNPVDHPHGGGEGVNPIGLKYPKTPWGKHALGVKTRKKKKYSSRFIVQRRPKK